jgi:hypothetical protein
MNDVCELCKKEFKVDDTVANSDFGLLHAEECFLEYCWQQFACMETYSYYHERQKKRHPEAYL